MTLTIWLVFICIFAACGVEQFTDVEAILLALFIIGDFIFWKKK